MQINLQKLQLVVVGIIAFGIFGGWVYLGYIVFFTGPKESVSVDLSSANPAVFSGFPKIQKVANAVTGGKKFFLTKKDYEFINSPIYQSFTEDPVGVSLSADRGREDPFVPLEP